MIENLKPNDIIYVKLKSGFTRIISVIYFNNNYNDFIGVNHSTLKRKRYYRSDIIESHIIKNAPS